MEPQESRHFYPLPPSLPVPPIPPPGNWVTGGRTGSEGTTRRSQVLIRTPRLIRMQPLCLARPSGRPGLPATGICPSPPRPPALPPVSGRGRGTSCSLKVLPLGVLPEARVPPAALPSSRVASTHPVAFPSHDFFPFLIDKKALLLGTAQNKKNKTA